MIQSESELRSLSYLSTIPSHSLEGAALQPATKLASHQLHNSDHICCLKV